MGRLLNVDFNPSSSKSSYQDLPEEERQKIKDLLFILEKFNGTLKKEPVIENVRAICWIVPQKYLLLLDQTILLQFRSSIDRPLNLPQYPVVITISVSRKKTYNQ
jgi:hypothetical protein